MFFDNNTNHSCNMPQTEMTGLPMMESDGWGMNVDNRCGSSTTCPPCPMPMTSCCPPSQVMEQPIQRCVTRDICHEVQHICPIDTKVINNHVFRHNYVPCFTCSEANVSSHVHTGSCCDFV